MKKDIKFSTRMASTDREKIRALAAKAHMSMSDYVTACCLGKQVVVVDGLKEVLKELKSIGRNLNQLYFFCIRRLANSRYHMEEKPLAEIEKVIRPLLGAYREVSARNPAGPVMENSQSVYVGLTYGRHTLTENMADQCPNRGMFA